MKKRRKSPRTKSIKGGLQLDKIKLEALDTAGLHREMFSKSKKR